MDKRLNELQRECAKILTFAEMFKKSHAKVATKFKLTLANIPNHSNKSSFFFGNGLIDKLNE